jgi:sigma-B regulation protein RsbU (phosphoserine phosphatase)
MTPAPTPTNERERLADLVALQILDTPPEERFDRIVRLAKAMFRVPIAYIALVDRNRQWFKAKEGLIAEQTGRTESFCGHAIMHDHVMIVPDAREDDRFRNNPLVIGEPYVRFYAGQPLKGPQKTNVGTLCIVSSEARTLSDHEQWMLRELAAMVEHELRLMDTIEAQRQLIAARQALADELAQAASYVRSLLPPKQTGDVTTDYHFVSSSQLGGDLFGYHWLDENQLAMYLLDVCGHGVGAALLSVSVQHAIRSQSLTNARFDQPHEVLSALNKTFPMDAHDGRFFTMWYGVYDRRERAIRYASAGHPPAILLSERNEESRLGCANLIAGVDENTVYDLHHHDVPAGSRLYLFSDGVFEAETTDGQLVGLAGLVKLLQSAPAGASLPRYVYDEIARVHGSTAFLDDFSLVEFCFR